MAKDSVDIMEEMEHETEEVKDKEAEMCLRRLRR